MAYAKPADIHDHSKPIQREGEEDSENKGKLENKTTYATAKADIPNPISKLNDAKFTQIDLQNQDKNALAAQLECFSTWGELRKSTNTQPQFDYDEFKANYNLFMVRAKTKSTSERTVLAIVEERYGWLGTYQPTAIVKFIIGANSNYTTRVEVQTTNASPGGEAPPAKIVSYGNTKCLLIDPSTKNNNSQRYVRVNLLPVELILDSNNIAYKPDSEALGVSNYVTNNELPATSQFGDTNPDPENFRLQARLPNATTNSVQMKLEVKRDGTVVSTTNYTLDKKDGDFVRGQFLRLVTDTNDDAESGDQTILVKLGDKIKVSYDIAAGSKVEQEIQVGRPSSEDNNEPTKPWKHDIREVKCRFVVFGNAATAAQIDQEIDTLNERYAQCGVKMKVVEKKLGEALPAEFANGGFTRGGSPIQIANADERELLNHLDSDNNTVDFMYVPDLNDGLGNAVRATAYRAGRNATGNAAFQNFVVVGPTRSELSVGHELMHVLLNISHRMSAGGAWLDATTALFHGTTTKAVDGTKRIGPYPAAASGVGNDDTTTIRNNAEQLP